MHVWLCGACGVCDACTDGRAPFCCSSCELLSCPSSAVSALLQKLERLWALTDKHSAQFDTLASKMRDMDAMCKSDAFAQVAGTPAKKDKRVIKWPERYRRMFAAV